MFRLIALLLGGLAVAVSLRAESLVALQDKFARATAAVDAGHAAGLSALQKQYLDALRAALTRASQNGDLEASALLDAEIRRVEGGGLIAQDKAAPAWLQQMQSRVQADRAGLAERRGQDLGSAWRQHLTALEGLEAGLRRDGKVEEAEGIRRERGQVLAQAKALGVTIPAVAEARPAAPAARHPAGPPLREGADWESRTSGVPLVFVWLPELKIWVGRTEVTEGQFQRFRPSLRVDAQRAQRPMVNVTYDEAFDYAEWLGQSERAARSLPEGARIRLPTEEEWTAYARCGKARDYPWGSTWPPTRGNYGVITGAKFLVFGKKVVYDDGHAGACPVEESGQNEWGLFGVGGNVWEACGKLTVGRSFSGWRGASFANSARPLMRIDARDLSAGDLRDPAYGFRLVVSP
jgi:formylglycine-generating enzyme required for sulfatase activity